MSKPVVIIYHDNCVDGFAAAWVAHKYWTEDPWHSVLLHPAKYGEEPPYDLCQDRIVCVVDFSYPREKMLQLDHVAFDLTVIDHHKTAIEACEGLSFCIFDMERSGAGLTWDTLFQGTPRPLFIDYIEDRDLWRFKLPGSKLVNAYIGTIDKTLEMYSHLALETDDKVLSKLGAGCLAQLEYYATATALLGRGVDLFSPGQCVWVVNCSPVGVSEVCDAALKNEHGPAIALGWYIANGALMCSLRSRGEVDVSAIAMGFGGGGHKNAAGFKLDLPDPFLELLIGVEPS